jgi:epidermal growth factor receptor substrate 15
MCKLVSLAQNRHPPSASITTTSPLPVFEGYSSSPSPQISEKSILEEPKRVSPPYSSFQPNEDKSAVYQLSKEERERYRAAFISCSPVSGLVPGDKARDLFVKSGLAMEVLSNIWFVPVLKK